MNLVRIYITVQCLCHIPVVIAFSPSQNCRISPLSVSGGILAHRHHDILPLNFRSAPPRNLSTASISSVTRNTFSSLLVAQPLPPSLSSTSSNDADPSNDDSKIASESDLTIRNASLSLRRTSWFSWWSQVILTSVSGITLLFARGVSNATTGYRNIPSGGLVFAGSGITLSILSILWTWGGARLSRRLLRNKNSKNSSRPYTRIDVATRIRRTVTVGCYINVLGMFLTLVGAEQIVGLLAAKALTTVQGVGFMGTGAGAGGLASQTLQPLDILVVQANTNTLLSHFVSLVSFLFLTASVRRLDPPSTEDEGGESSSASR